MKTYRLAVSWITTAISLWAAALLTLMLTIPGWLPAALAGILLGVSAVSSLVLILHTRSRLEPARRDAAQANNARIASSRLTLQPITSLRLLPLVEFAGSDPELSSTFAVSYFVESDQDHILFDMGIKLWEEDEAVIYRNERVLRRRESFSFEQVDCIVNSHAHNDHLGASPDEPILAETNNPLRGKPYYAVDPLDVRGGGLHIVDHPTLISPTAGLTGPLTSHLFVLGRTNEQSLVFHLTGRGLVVIVGCGHPGLELIVEACERVFEQPVWGLIGGLHYPVTGDRTGMGLLLHPQQLIGGPHSYPWRPISKRQVDQEIEYLQQKKVQYVALSAHDSCDWALQRFQDSALSTQILQTGQQITL